MFTLTQIGIAIFALAVAFGPLYSVEEYVFISNLISELGAQHTQNNFIMIIAFIILGGSIIIDGSRKYQVSLLPFILFGLAMVLLGLFPHKPIDTSLAFNSTFHNLHGVIATVAGTAITVGFIWQGFLMKGKHRILCFYLAAVSLVFPLLMLTFPNYQGLIQRLMYLQILGWIWTNYPIILTNKQLQLIAQNNDN